MQGMLSRSHVVLMTVPLPVVGLPRLLIATELSSQRFYRVTTDPRDLMQDELAV